MLRSGMYSVLSCCALFFAGCGSLSDPFGRDAKKDDGVTVQAKVRDIHEGNATSRDGTHPHFNQNQGSCEAQKAGVKTVQAGIDTSGGTDADFPGDNRGPRLADSLPAGISKCFDPPARFGEWFNDQAEDINRSFLVDLLFAKEDGGIFAYRNNKFFPIDNGADFAKAKAGGPETFGHLQTGAKDGADLTQHNYGFTMEFHTFLTYKAGAGQFIAFEGDDDLWAFVDGRRVIDLGGIHAAQRDTVRLDGLGLTDQGKYPLDFFFAERAVASSKLSIVTNVAFTNE